MQKKSIRFSTAKVNYYQDASFSSLRQICGKNLVILTDRNVFNAQKKRISGYPHIVVPAGEPYKNQKTAYAVIEQLISMGADRQTTLVGVGGGVITDLAGYIASVYMRGIPFGFVPSSLLAMVDAAIGGKNGIDVGALKNMIGTIRQPSFILYDMNLLATLPHKEWNNGFAEIIKHASIRQASLFRELEKIKPVQYRKNKIMLKELVRQNVMIKTGIVKSDEFETGERKILNFGHTIGHALENSYQLSHGEAVSVGMVYASAISEKLTGFRDKERLIHLLEKFDLPVEMNFDRDKVFHLLRMDKKKTSDRVSFILLEKIGKAVIRPISFNQLYKFL